MPVNYFSKTQEVKGLQRFTHYEQGIDVAKYMDTIVISKNCPMKEIARKETGLDLSNEIIDGIFKHTYDHDRDENEYKSLKFLFRHTKYTNEIKGGNSGSLEAQLVRICDKISYFISDIEDGLIVDAFHINDITDAVDVVIKNFKKPKKEFVARLEELFEMVKKRYDYYSKSTELYRQIKDALLTIVVDSVIKTSQQKIEKEKYQKYENGGYNLIIEADDSVKDMMSHIYKELLEDRLFSRNILVKKENNRAEHIISCLFCQYARHPELIPWGFRSRYTIPTDNKIFEALKEIYLKQQEGTLSSETKTSKKDTLLKPVHLDLSPWFTNNRRPKGVECPFSKNFSNIQLSPADLICIKDFMSGMTNNYAEVRFQGDVDCNASRAYWKEENMDRKSFLIFH